ncbi:MAG TPA: ABC transporter permease [Candidatus Saccharimonadales bacterium]|nr:ABC transporter permease [Candidatus Saccharimonadales bacterium]
MKRYFYTIWVLASSYTRQFFRDKVALFFTFLFPLLFLLVFGALNKGGNDINFNIVLINHSQTQFAKEFVDEAKKNKVFKIKDNITTLAEAKERMGRGEIDSIIELPGDFGKPNEQNIPSGTLVVYYEEASPQTGQTLGGIMQRVLDGINKELTNHVDPFVVEQKSTKTANLTSFDYIFAGLLGFSILSLGIFGMANGFPADKKVGILRRLKATPLRVSQLVIGTALTYLLIGLLSIVLMIIVGTLIFDFNMRGNYLNLFIFLTIGIACMFGFGLAIGGWAKNENQAAPLSNLVAFPLMFLSGVFFPTFLMPQWLQQIVQFLPLTPIVDGTRLIITENASLLSLGPELAIIGAWIAIIYALGFKLFRWE